MNDCSERTNARMVTEANIPDDGLMTDLLDDAGDAIWVSCLSQLPKGRCSYTTQSHIKRMHG